MITGGLIYYLPTIIAFIRGRGFRDVVVLLILNNLFGSNGIIWIILFLVAIG
ncbi:MAG: superinfection immunity protein [Nitrososphaeraceae archaeon]